MNYEQEIQDIDNYREEELNRVNDMGWGCVEKREVTEICYDKLLALAKKMQEEMKINWNYGTKVLPECPIKGIDFNYGDCSGSDYDTASWSKDCYIYVPEENEIVIAKLVTFEDSDLRQEWMTWGFMTECDQRNLQINEVSAWILKSEMHATLQHPLEEK